MVRSKTNLHGMQSEIDSNILRILLYVSIQHTQIQSLFFYVQETQNIVGL